MSRIVTGVAASHSTLMNTHWDSVVDVEAAERFRDGLTEAASTVARAEPDVAIIVGSNHFRGFWLDLLPQFTIGVGEVDGAGEAGTPKGPQLTDPTFAHALATGLVNSGFDPAVSARIQIDHGQTHAIQYVLADQAIPVVPVVVNVFAPPLPTVSRCVALGRAIAAVVDSIPDDRRVAVIASGGLSHQLPWPSNWAAPEGEDEEFLVEAWINGRGQWERYDARRRQIITSARPSIAEEFDRTFLGDLDRGELHKYAELDTPALERLAGNGGQEIRTWMIAAAAMGLQPGRTLAYSPMPEWLTGMGVAVFDGEAV